MFLLLLISLSLSFLLIVIIDDLYIDYKQENLTIGCSKHTQGLFKKKVKQLILKNRFLNRIDKKKNEYIPTDKEESIDDEEYNNYLINIKEFSNNKDHLPWIENITPSGEEDPKEFFHELQGRITLLNENEKKITDLNRNWVKMKNIFNAVSAFKGGIERFTISSNQSSEGPYKLNIFSLYSYNEKSTLF